MEKKEIKNKPFEENMNDQKGLIIHGKAKAGEKVNKNLSTDDKKHLESRVNYSSPDQAVDNQLDEYNTSSNWNSDWKQ